MPYLDINDFFGRTPLYLAVIQNNLNIIRVY